MAVTKTKKSLKTSTTSSSKTKTAATTSSTKKSTVKTGASKKPVRIEGNIRSALARQVITGAYNKEQCIRDVKSFTVGVSEGWRNGFIDFLENEVNSDGYFRALCNNALVNKNGKYDGIPVIRYWEK